MGDQYFLALLWFICLGVIFALAGWIAEKLDNR